MADLEQFKTVDLIVNHANDNTFIPRQYASAGDVAGRTTTLQVTDDGLVNELPGIGAIAAWYNRASGQTGLDAFEIVDKSKNILVWAYPQSMLTPGTVEVVISIQYQGKSTDLRKFTIEVQSVNGQMAGIVSSEAYKALTSALARVNEYDTQIASLDFLKASKGELDQAMANFSSSAPKESFDSLNALQTKYPNGKTGTFLVKGSDNNYYTYIFQNSWKNLGLYQAATIDNDSITLEKLSAFQKQAKWFSAANTPVYDPSTVTIDFKADIENRMLYRLENGFQFLPEGTKVTYSGSNTTTSALILLFNLVKKEFRLTSYDQTLTADEIYVGVLRRDGTKYNLPFPIEIKGAKKKIEVYTNNSKLHLSFDDVSAIFVDLMNKKGTYKSAFDNPFLAKLKSYSDSYNAKFSLYVFLDEFLLMDNTYKKDFYENSDWLKFGFHQKKDVDNYLNTSYDKAASDYSAFISQLYTVCGTYNALDRLPRLQNFSVNEVSAQAMKDNGLGVYGFLTPDDSRNVTYLGATNEAYLRTHDQLYDQQLNLHFFSTDLRLENSANVTNDLSTKLANYTNADMNKTIVVFSHEYIFYDSSGMKSTSKLDEVMNFARSNNIVFDFPQNLIHYKECAVNPFKKVEQLQFDFVSGHIDANGNYTTSDTRMRTSYIYIPKNKKLVIDCGSNYSIATYKTITKSNNGLVASAWTSGKQEITSDGKSYYRFSVKRNDDSTSIKNEVDNIKFSLVSN